MKGMFALFQNYLELQKCSIMCFKMSDKNTFVTKNTIIPPNSDVSYPTKKIHPSLPPHPGQDNLNSVCKIKVTGVDYVHSC